MPTEEDDPVIASYNVFISPQPTLDLSKPSPKLYVLQYPSHRPQTRPYTTSRSQKPTSLRIKPETGIFEIDIPLFTSEHYNPSKGHEYGKAMHDAKQHNPYTSHGLSGGFSQNPPSHPQPIPATLSDVPAHNSDGINVPTQQLTTQVLGGKVAPISDRTPVYMLATMSSKTKEMHLTHIDAVVQLRPQLHHIDALDDQKRRADTASRFKNPTNSTSNSNANDTGPGPAPVKLETKAIEMKVKDASKEDPNRSLNVNAKLLREIQADRWLQHDWIEPPANNNNNTNANEAYSPPIHIHSTPQPQQFTPTNHRSETASAKNTHTWLKSALDNDEWLNKMSSPGIELRTRLKGRDRERARRKRQERLRAAKADGIANSAGSAGAAAGARSGAGVSAAAATSTSSTGAEGGARAGGTMTGTGTGPFVDGSASETASSDEDEEEEDEEQDHEQGEGADDMAVDESTPEQRLVLESPRVKIKQESATASAATAVDGMAEQTPSTALSPPTATQTQTLTPKRRGRPPKK